MIINPLWSDYSLDSDSRSNYEYFLYEIKL